MAERSRPFTRIAAPIRSLAQRFMFLGLILAAAALMLLGKVDVALVERTRIQVTDAMAPILDVLSRPLDAIDHAVVEGRELLNVRAENARLKADNERLLRWQAAARKLEAENRALKGLLNFKAPGDASFIAARVIADAGGTFAHSLLLNAGEREGARKGQAVVIGSGLAGRVQEVGARSARILLITDLNSRIPVLIEPSRTRAVLAGTNTDRPRLVHLPPGAVVTEGDRIVTSGHAGAFPQGLPVGVVASVGEGGIDIQPFVDRARLEVVRILDFGLDGIIVRERRSGSGGDIEAVPRMRP